MDNIDELKLDVNKKMDVNYRELKDLLNNRSSKVKDSDTLLDCLVVSKTD